MLEFDVEKIKGLHKQLTSQYVVAKGKGFQLDEEP